LLEFADDLLGRLRHRHTPCKGDAAAAGRGAEADRRRVADYRADILEWNAEDLGHHQRHPGARAADIGVSLGDGDRAVLVDVAGRTRFTAGIVPVARGDAASLAGPERRLEVLAGLGCLQGLLVADIDPGRTVRRLGALLGAVDLAQFERIDAEFAG